MAKGYAVCNSWGIDDQNETTAYVRGGGYFQFGSYYYYGVRTHLYINGSEVASNTGYTTSSNQRTAYVSKSRHQIPKTHAAQSIQVYVTSTSETVSGYGGIGESSTSTKYTITVPPKTSYAVSYDANGGTGAPGEQVKWYGEDLDLSSSIPTRENYNFLGWSTDPAATTAMYLPGATYSGNARLELYAVWELAYRPPTITGFSAARTTPDSTDATASFSWAIDTTIAGNTVDSVSIQYRQDDSQTWNSATVATPSGTSGTSSASIVGLSIDHSYEVRFTVTDTQGGETRARTLISPAFFTMDVLAGGKAIALGKPATSDYSRSNGILDSGMDVGLSGNLLALDGNGDYQPGTSGQVLISQGDGNPPAWETSLAPVSRTLATAWSLIGASTSVYQAVSTTGWNYEIYADGTVHGWGRIEISNVSMQTFNNLRRSTGSYYMPYPVELSELTYIMFGPWGKNSQFGSTIMADLANYPNSSTDFNSKCVQIRPVQLGYYTSTASGQVFRQVVEFWGVKA